MKFVGKKQIRKSKLLHMKVLEKSEQEQGEVISPIFLVQKSDGCVPTHPLDIPSLITKLLSEGR